MILYNKQTFDKWNVSIFIALNLRPWAHNPHFPKQEMVRWAEAPHEGKTLQTEDSLSDSTQKRLPKLGENSCHKRSTITGVHRPPGFIPHSPWILGRLATSSGYRLTEMWWHLSEEAALKLRYTVNVNLCEKNTDICRVVALDLKSENEKNRPPAWLSSAVNHAVSTWFYSIR